MERNHIPVLVGIMKGAIEMPEISDPNAPDVPKKEDRYYLVTGIYKFPIAVYDSKTDRRVIEFEDREQAMFLLNLLNGGMAEAF